LGIWLRWTSASLVPLASLNLFKLSCFAPLRLCVEISYFQEKTLCTRQKINTEEFLQDVQDRQDEDEKRIVVLSLSYPAYPAHPVLTLYLPHFVQYRGENFKDAKRAQFYMQSL
jgi:hypothetical protein